MILLHATGHLHLHGEPNLFAAALLLAFAAYVGLYCAYAVARRKP